MDIHIITGFPSLLSGPLNESMLKQAQQRGGARIWVHDVRDYAEGKHRQIDDYPYGGGAGMILKPEPIFRCVETVRDRFSIQQAPLTFMSATGERFDQKRAVELSFREALFILCGHYKGIDERVREELVDEELSIGDYILTGGELAALVVVDSVVRLLPGVLNDIDSADTDSFQSGLLDHPHYTRPEDFRGKTVPAVLRSGDHAKIEQWRRERSLEITRKRRKDLFDKYHD